MEKQIQPLREEITQRYINELKELGCEVSDCPVCYITAPVHFMKQYECMHYICSSCYSKTINILNGTVMHRCPLCRREGQPDIGFVDFSSSSSSDDSD